MRTSILILNAIILSTFFGCKKKEASNQDSWLFKCCDYEFNADYILGFDKGACGNRQHDWIFYDFKEKNDFLNESFDWKIDNEIYPVDSIISPQNLKYHASRYSKLHNEFGKWHTLKLYENDNVLFEVPEKYFLPNPIEIKVFKNDTLVYSSGRQKTRVKLNPDKDKIKVVFNPSSNHEKAYLSIHHPYGKVTNTNNNSCFAYHINKQENKSPQYNYNYNRYKKINPKTKEIVLDNCLLKDLGTSYAIVSIERGNKKEYNYNGKKYVIYHHFREDFGVEVD